jgi:hypothetical protein
MAAVEADSFESGKRKEMEYAAILFQSGQAAALQYAFFAQRKAVQVRCHYENAVMHMEILYSCWQVTPISAFSPRSKAWKR